MKGCPIVPRRVFITCLIWLNALRLGAAQTVETKQLVAGNTAFGFDLYFQLKEHPESANLFYSPFNISTCLAIASAGARGNTETLMGRVLHLSIRQGWLHASFGELQKQIEESARKNGVELNIANALWMQAGSPFLSEFIGTAREHYGAELKQADFKTGAEGAALEISQWISAQTHGRIQNMFGPGSFTVQDQLVLASALYFKSRWSSIFNPIGTALQTFYVSSSNKVVVPLMHHFDTVKYAESDSFQMVELPYTGEAFSMIILLPRRSDSLAQLESWLNPRFVSEWIRQMRKQEVEIFLPRFKLQTNFDLKDELGKIGMAAAFAPGADFSGMNGAGGLFISRIKHQAYVEVDEEGTEAAAATGMAATAGPAPPPPPRFRADHPFVFLIQHVPTGSVLFLGRLMDPAK